MGDPQTRVMILQRLGTLSAATGDLLLAEQRHREAFALACDFGDRRLAAQSQLDLGTDLLSAGDLNGAREELAAALVRPRHAPRAGTGPPRSELRPASRTDRRRAGRCAHRREPVGPGGWRARCADRGPASSPTPVGSSCCRRCSKRPIPPTTSSPCTRRPRWRSPVREWPGCRSQSCRARPSVRPPRFSCRRRSQGRQVVAIAAATGTAPGSAVRRRA